ncbi:hypothetical protein QBC47DRAFT_385163 [Echria macrotheca]|uniref:Uncharacterized protein n=1 Tax=Echria macrotheca TaxID=438768 RepID=A0AAJ0F4X8_9PEZI|nr:hypothetical protein QBC47DRAFT_385163 [Echria macrotheca]
MAETTSAIPLPAQLAGKTVVGDNGAGYYIDRAMLRRGLFALPLLAIAIVAGYVMDARPAVPFARVLIDRGEVAWEEGIFYRIPILSTLYGVQSLDDVISIANTFFLPAVYGYNPGSRTQITSFLADGAVVLCIWWLESLRRGDRPWYLQHPSILALLSQFLSLGVVCPLYCFLSYIDSPSLESMLQGPRSSPLSLLPALLLGYYIPGIAMLFWPDLGERQAWLSVWQLYPIHVSVARYVLSLVAIGKPKTQGETPLVKFQRELLVTRVCVGFAVVVGAATWLSTLWSAGFAFPSVFVPTSMPARSLPDFTAFCGLFLRWDELFSFASMFVWLGYVYHDAKKADLVRTSWSDLALRGVLLSVLLGPGATMGLGWLWREEAVAARREKEALLLEVAAKVDFLLKENGA